MYISDLKYARNKKELNNLINQDVGMGFGIGKCAILLMNKGEKKNKTKH